MNETLFGNRFLSGIGRVFSGGKLRAWARGESGAGETTKFLTHNKSGVESTMTKENIGMGELSKTHDVQKSGRFLGSLKDALVAAGRDDTANAKPAAASAPKAIADPAAAVALPPPLQSAAAGSTIVMGAGTGTTKSALEAARDARAGTTAPDLHADSSAPPTTRVVKDKKSKTTDTPARTQLVRGRQEVKRGGFESDPVVGWLVVVGGPGVGQYRPVFEGNNAIGRSTSQRIALDFGDDSISSEEQAYIRYDSTDRSFLFVPNLSKTNVVSINNKRPTGAVELAQMDVIMMGRTQLVFVPFCGAEFDWAELGDTTK